MTAPTTPPAPEAVEADPHLVEGAELPKKKGFGFGFWLSVGWLALIIGSAALADFLQR